MVYVGWLGSHPATIGVKYAAQAWQTWRVLNRERPDVVFVMSPPVFAAIPVLVYAWRRRAEFVIDAHTCAFVLRRWKPFLWLQRWLCRRAITTLVTNEHLAGLVREAGGHATIVPDVPIVFNHPAPSEVSDFHVVVVSSFDVDEPIAAILDAAAKVPDVPFFISGDPSGLDPALAASRPPNVTFTGFLGETSYGRLVSGASVVLDLTSEDHTMLRGAYEAIYQGVPVIVSDWPILREAFPFGASHVDNTAEAIAAAVAAMREDLARHKADAGRLRDQKLRRWEQTRRAILERLPPGVSTVEA